MKNYEPVLLKKDNISYSSFQGLISLEEVEDNFRKFFSILDICPPLDILPNMPSSEFFQYRVCLVFSLTLLL